MHLWEVQGHDGSRDLESECKLENLIGIVMSGESCGAVYGFKD